MLPSGESGVVRDTRQGGPIYPGFPRLTNIPATKIRIPQDRDVLRADKRKNSSYTIRPLWLNPEFYGLAGHRVGVLDVPGFLDSLSCSGLAPEFA